MSEKEELQAMVRVIGSEFENEIDNLIVLNVRGVQVLRWAYQSPYSGLDAIDDVVDSVKIFLDTVGDFIDNLGLITAAEMTDTDFGIVDYVYSEESLNQYQKVFTKIWGEEN